MSFLDGALAFGELAEAVKFALEQPGEEAMWELYTRRVVTELSYTDWKKQAIRSSKPAVRKLTADETANLIEEAESILSEFGSPPE
jgi:hypothetical protein